MPENTDTQRSSFLEAEILSSRLSLLPGKRPSYFNQSSIKGLLSKQKMKQTIQSLEQLDVDAYIQQTVSPSENPKRRSAPEVIRQLGGTLIHEELDGPLYLAEWEFHISGRARRFGFIAQNRKNQNGVWYPEHHLKAAEKARFFDSHSMPIITFMDTPGAAADVDANLKSQSHSISFFIAEMANLAVPTVGIVFGHGYSGGAIPLATTNILLSVEDGVFNTIHPKGLSNIARKYNLSWQECAKYTGVSPHELCMRGYFDGVIDYTPDAPKKLQHLRDAIFTAVDCVEANASEFLASHPFFFDHYQNNIRHFLNPSEMLIEDNKLTDKTPTGLLNIFGSVYRFLRYLKMRHKITSQSVFHYSRLSQAQIPKGTLQERLDQERQQKFHKWLQSPLEIRYHDELNKKYKRFLETTQSRTNERGKLAALFMGTPEENYEQAVEDLGSTILTYLYNHWKGDAQDNLLMLLQYLQETPPNSTTSLRSPDLLDLLKMTEVFEYFQKNVYHMVLFDRLYDGIVQRLPLIAEELKGTNRISKASVEKLLEAGFQTALKGSDVPECLSSQGEMESEFLKWLAQFVSRKNCDQIMGTITDWKQIMFPRLSPPLFGLVRYYFSNLLPSLYKQRRGSKKFDGKLTPRNIGIKDFWNRLDQAYKDLLIHNVLREYKQKAVHPRDIIESFFTDFEELFESYMTADPARFPGFRQSIEQAMNKDLPACGVITGLATYSDKKLSTQVGLVISNSQFQAGAFDMASCEKVCRLLAECARRELPVIMFISSGGMQTKEGAGALFSMSVVNDRLTRFVKDHDLPVICFGFRDCMGGAQASFVTHRLVKTYYLSGTLMSFAGQLVVESHLTTSATLSNYLSASEGNMEGLVHNPFDESVDARLQKIDPKIPTANTSIQDVISKILSGEFRPSTKEVASNTNLFAETLKFRPIQRLLIHARGCTAARLIQGAHDAKMEVVLVQSDADMDSYPTKLLNESDRLICLGGNTAQESYLNAMSVVYIAEQEKADAIHPGIGFLSESPSYAKLCREQKLGFIGPRAASMDLMGNKSNAIATARRLKIPIVPGSQGALTQADQAQEVANTIGFPVLIKSAHGGGGKGIRVVWNAEEFPKLFTQMSQEAFNAFGNGDLYLEKYIQSMRHLEVQVVRDRKGQSLLLGIRDCSVQRQFQKLIEESTDFVVSEKVRKQLYEHTKVLIDEIDYIGAGTVEFIYDRQDQKVYFMEMNTRLQVEHPVTEAVYRTDLVQYQLHIAQGKYLPSTTPEPKGHAIEIRINAERIDRTSDGNVQFLPDPGTLSKVHFPEMHHIRVIPAVTTGSTIPPYYDSLVAQIIASGDDRQEAIQHLLEYLPQIQINGIFTNMALMQAILEDSVFQSGDYDTNYIQGFLENANLYEIEKKTKEHSGSADVTIDRRSIEIEDSNELKVLAPQTGAFYRSNSPNDPSFVSEGQVIKIDQTLCLLESMKIFKEVSLSSYNQNDNEPLYQGSQNYEVKRILAEDQQTVTKGDLLFIMQPVPVTATEEA